MKQYLRVRPALWFCLLALPVASAQAGKYDDEEEPLNSFALSYTMGLNIKAGFKNVSLAPNFVLIPNQQGVLTATQVNPGSTSGQGSHVYDNGYLLTDASGNALGYSSYWGYQSASQVQNGTIVMNATAPTLGAGPQNLNGDPQHGIDFTYRRQLGRWGGIRWGVEGGFGFTDLTIDDHQTVAGNYSLISDAYTLPALPGGGVVTPPPPPYQGPYSAPPGSPLLGATPSRTTSPISSVDQFSLRAQVYIWRLGPYLRAPFWNKRFAVSLSGGLAIIDANSQFSFQESVPRPGMAPLLSSGSGWHNDLLVGGYVDGSLSMRLTRSTDIVAGARYTKTGNSSNVQAGKEARIDFGNSLFVTLGLNYKF